MDNEFSPDRSTVGPPLIRDGLKDMQKIFELEADKAALISACDLALDWADANARWFDISTAPMDEGVSFLVTTEVRSHLRSWTETHVVHLNEEGEIHPDCHQGWCLRDYWHWRPLPPPPSNPPFMNCASA